MSRILTTLLLLVVLLPGVPTTEAEEQMFSSSLDSLPLGELINQDGWTTTKSDPGAYGSVRVSDSNLIPEEKFIELTTDSSIAASRSLSPQNAGIFEFKAKHNKSGLFYIYAQTSDNGGQLLFSIQFTEDRGVLLEESDKQVTLLSDYSEDQWYLFTIEFDNSRGARGVFTVKIDGQSYGEFEYVMSESSTFDIAQITIGSENIGKSSVSGFADSFPSVLTTVASTTSDALLLLSISLSSTSISSSLENGLIVTATLDGIASVATSSIYATDTATSVDFESSTSTESDEDSSVGSFIMDIVESVIEIFTPAEPVPEESPNESTATSTLPLENNPSDEATTTPIQTVPIIDEPSTTEPTSSEPVLELPTPEPVAEEPVVTENEVQSSLSTDDTPTNEITTTTF
jgi:hypothetical protein